jgi:hypothetical protein
MNWARTQNAMSRAQSRHDDATPDDDDGDPITCDECSTWSDSDAELRDDGCWTCRDCATEVE